MDVAGERAGEPFTPRAVILNGVDDILALYSGAMLRFSITPGFELDPASGITVSIDQGDLRFGAVLPGYTSYSVDPDASGAFFHVPIAHSSGDCSITATTLTFRGGRVRQRLDATSIATTGTIGHGSAPGGAVASSFTVWSLQSSFDEPGMASVRGDQAYTRLGASNAIVLDGIDDWATASPGETLHFGVGPGFELDPTSSITVSIANGAGPLRFGASLPGSTSITVYPDATGAYLDVPIAHSSGDATRPHDRPVHGRRGPAATGQRRRRVPRVARAPVIRPRRHGRFVPRMDAHRPHRPGDAERRRACPATIPATAITFDGSGHPILPAAGSYTTCTATGSGHDWAGNGPAHSFVAAGTFWEIAPGAGLTGAGGRDRRGHELLGARRPGART